MKLKVEKITGEITTAFTASIENLCM